MDKPYIIRKQPLSQYQSATGGATLVAYLALAVALVAAANHQAWSRDGTNLLLTFSATAMMSVLVLRNIVWQYKDMGLNRTPLLPAIGLLLNALLCAVLARIPAVPLNKHGFMAVAMVCAVGVVIALWSLTLAMIALRRQLPVVSPANNLYLVWHEAKTMAAQPSQAGASPAVSTPTVTNVAEQPRLNFQTLVGQDELKTRLKEVMGDWKTKGSNGLVLFGEPGTGKTAFADALACELGIKIIRGGFSAINSKWVGEGTERLQRLFADARAQQPCVLFIDEADAVIQKRGDSGTPAEYDRMVNVFLEEAVKLRDHKVLLVAATNFIDNLDPAAIRVGRFDFKVEVPLPDAKAREHLIRTTMAAKKCTADDAMLGRLINRWGGFNVKHIMAVAEGACDIAIADGSRNAMGFEHFLKSLRKIQGRKAGPPEGAKDLRSLYYDDEIKTKLSHLAAQLSDMDRLEARGGKLPTGMLLFGEPGTGKTAAAQALAKACGWTFIATTGKQLMSRDAIRDLKSRASDLRPVIVFVDEADDILGQREHSYNKDATAELLALMDGAGGNLHDVFWIAATNYPESIDSAAKRGGRLSLKLSLDKPSETVMRKLVADWGLANAGRIPSPAEAWVDGAASILLGLSQASAFEVLKQAVNDGIMEDFQATDIPKVQLRHLVDAKQTLLGDQ